MTTLEQLRKSGRYQITVHHDRVVSFPSFEGKPHIKHKMVPLNEVRKNNRNARYNYQKWHIEPHGGKTKITIVDTETNEVYSATTICSKKDNFNKRVSLSVCLGRLIKESGIKLS